MINFNKSTNDVKFFFAILLEVMYLFIKFQAKLQNSTQNFQI